MDLELEEFQLAIALMYRSLTTSNLLLRNKVPQSQIHPASLKEVNLMCTVTTD